MFGSSGRSFRWVLAVSLAFNLCFVGAFAFGQIRTRLFPVSQGPLTDLPPDFPLPAEKQQAIREDCARIFTQVEPIHKEMAAQRQHLMDLVLADTPDQEAISAQLDSITALQRKAQALVIAHILKEKSLLVPEQREAFERMLRKRLCPRAFGGRGAFGGPMGSGCAAVGEPAAPAAN